MICRCCGGSYPSSRHKGPYCSLRCAFKAVRNRERKPEAVPRIDPSRLPKPMFEPSRRKKRNTREKLTCEELRLVAELEMNGEEFATRKEKVLEAAEKRRGCRNSRSWTPEMEEKVMRMKRQGATLDQIAQETGKTWAGVEARIRQIRKREKNAVAQ